MSSASISVEAYGCTMNSGEARLAAELLEGLGYEVVRGPVDPSGDGPGAFIVFTCDVIDTTERRMYRRMDEIISSGGDLFVAGCLPMIDPAEVKRRFPGAVLMNTMGTDNLMRSVRENFPAVEVHSGQETTGGGEESGLRRIDHIVPIATGCTGSCSYCITKKARGVHISDPAGQIIRRIGQGAARGRREILLTSQDTGAWGSDLESEMDLPSLIERITLETTDDIRIRIGMMNPEHIERYIDRLMDAMDDRRIFRFLHLPVQSGSDRILNLMGRRYSVASATGSIEKIRKRFPDITISTDVIAGFPSETEEDHAMTMSMVSEIRPDILNITRFSRRRGTPSDNMEGQVPGWISKERSRAMTRLHESITGNRLKERMGYHPGCLVTEVGRKGTMMARDMNYTPIVIEGTGKLLGRSVDIETFETGPTYLVGTIR